LLAIGNAQELALRGDVQGDVALELDGADDEYSCGDKDRATLVGGAGIDGGLDGGGVESLAIALGAVVTDIVDARAGIVCAAWGGRGHGRLGGRIGGGDGHGCSGNEPEPLAPGQ